jgi:hypothetical protein
MIRALQNVLTLPAMTLPEPLQVITKQTLLCTPLLTFERGTVCLPPIMSL